MKQDNILFILLIGLVTSCYKVYDPQVGTTEKVLVVDGLLTNQTDAYHVVLSYARPFNSTEKSTPVSSANVYVTDNLGNSYVFNEKGNGDYKSDSLQFTGIPGLSYKLHIVTPDGKKYESDSQRLFPESYPDSVYTEFDNQVILDQSTGLKVNTHGTDILIDIRNQSDTLARYRFTSNLVRQYFYIIYPVYEPEILFYCWLTADANSNINLTDEKYTLNSASIKKHLVCFLDDNLYCNALYYLYSESVYQGKHQYKVVLTAFYQSYEIHHRILYLNLYTVNNETYLYYKSLNEQMQSEGKLFDPIAAQLIGNIKCISDPGTNAIGFFEASSVNKLAYIVDFRNLTNSQPTLIKTPYILPPETIGCRINDAPSFWIFK
jgi:hypothetical protein